MQEKELQWHPAFYADLQIELQDDSDNLIFENEHLLGTKPTQIDVLVVKKKKDIPISKNIGQIFKTHNLFEYKGPTDYLNVNDFYKVYAYACFYKSLAKTVNEIDITDITISFVCKEYPRAFVSHLKEVRGYEVEQIERGIYRIRGDIISMQLIVIKELSKTKNLWLHSLTNELTGAKEAENLIQEYQKYKSNKLYESVMDIIVRANEKQFEEVQNMCKALEELMADVIQEKVNLGEKRGSDDKTRTFVKNMLLRGMSDADIIALAECDQKLIEDVRKNLD